MSLSAGESLASLRKHRRQQVREHRLTRDDENLPGAAILVF